MHTTEKNNCNKSFSKLLMNKWQQNVWMTKPEVQKFNHEQENSHEQECLRQLESEHSYDTSLLLYPLGELLSLLCNITGDKGWR